MKGSWRALIAAAASPMGDDPEIVDLAERLLTATAKVKAKF